MISDSDDRPSGPVALAWAQDLHKVPLVKFVQRHVNSRRICDLAPPAEGNVMTSAVSRLPSATSHAEASALPAACTIAISREAGALGSSVGQELATQLGWRLYDQELLDQLASEMGLQPSLLDGVDERPMSWVRELLESFSSQAGTSTAGYSHRLIKKLVALASRGECIIVGRGAPHILPAGSTLRVRLVAPRAFRIAAIQRLRGIMAAEAERWMDATDRKRIRFVTEWPGKDATDPGLYDLVLNVSRFTVPQAASVVIDALRHLEQNRARQWQPA